MRRGPDPGEVAGIASAFAIPGRFENAERHGSGHINDTFKSTWRANGATHAYVHQRINAAVFVDPPGVMANVSAVLAHLRRRLEAAGAPDLERRVLTLVPARDGASFVRDAGGGCWRTYRFVERSRSVDVVENEAQAEAAARAFGEFQRLLADYDGPRLVETIAGFHDTPRRFAALARAAREDRHGRAASARAEIAFALDQEATAGSLHARWRDGSLPERVVHNDTKLNNLLLDARTGEPLCVIDLDTVMPGLTAHDYGDLVRTGASRAAEDERDLDQVRLDLGLFEAITRGYLATARAFLTEAERDALVTGAEVIVLEIGLRFLADHLDGDAYFRVHRENQNLDRARVQLRLLRDLQERREDLAGRVRRLARG
jgi:Ser/Thr protein kinase RdoA (MazF antagonist)